MAQKLTFDLRLFPLSENKATNRLILCVLWLPSKHNYNTTCIYIYINYILECLQDFIKKKQVWKKKRLHCISCESSSRVNDPYLPTHTQLSLLFRQLPELTIKHTS